MPASGPTPGSRTSASAGCTIGEISPQGRLERNGVGKRVGILMGSANDMDKVAPAGAILERFGVEVDMVVMSAHRDPAKVTAFAVHARDEGYGVVICAAGMAAALPGAVAAHTTLPVIGLPLSGSALN